MCTSEAQCTPRNIPNVSCQSTKRKIDFSTLSVSPTSPVLNTRRNKNISIIPVLCTESTSPILNSRKKRQNCSETECFTTSPVLHTRRNSASPVINSKEIVKLRKQGILESNKKINCARKLQYETNTQEEANNDILRNIKSVDDFDNDSKKFTLNFKSEHIKEPVKNKPIFKTNSLFNENFKYKKRKRKRNHRNYKRMKTCDDEKIEIETVCSQELPDNIEKSIIEKLESPRNIFKNITINKNNSNKIWSLKSVEEQIQENFEIELVSSQKIETPEIEIVNSQEICKPSEIFATKFQPRELIIETSQNSYTPRSTIIETDLSQNEQKIVIDVEESQSSSALSNISNCTVVQDSFEKSSDEHIWSPVKKKNYKPGTYSHKFQRILRKQKANTTIWKHELYLANTTNYEIPPSEDDTKITVVEICKINTDYGMSILECVEVSNKEKCLIIADLNQFLSDIVLKTKDLIKIFPPYFIEYLKLDQCDMKTYVNVHKVLKCT